LAIAEALIENQIKSIRVKRVRKEDSALRFVERAIG